MGNALHIAPARITLRQNFITPSLKAVLGIGLEVCNIEKAFAK
jgi:hypothetical protein